MKERWVIVKSKTTPDSRPYFSASHEVVPENWVQLTTWEPFWREVHSPFYYHWKALFGPPKTDMEKIVDAAEEKQ